MHWCHMSRQHMWSIGWGAVVFYIAFLLPLSYGAPPPPPKPGCGGNYTASYDNLSGSSITPKETCTWNILPDDKNSTSETGILLIFQDLVLLAGDNLRILSENGTIVFGPYNETQGSFSIMTGEKKVIVELETGKTPGSRDFTAFYNAENCSFSFQSLEIGYLSSPIYSSSLSGQKKYCNFSFSIKEKSDYSLLLHFQHFNFSGNSTVDITTLAKNLTNANAEESDFIIADHFNITILYNLSVPDQGFLFTYQRVFRVCSDMIKVRWDDPMPTLTAPKLDAHLKRIPERIECRWIIKADYGVVSVDVKNLDMKNPNDHLVLFNGGTFMSPSMLLVTPQNQNETKGLNIMTSGPYLMVAYSSLSLDTSNDFAIDVTMHEFGGYFKNNGSFGIDATPKHPLKQPAMFLLEVPDGLQVSLNVSSSKPMQDGILDVYDSFYSSANQIAKITKEGQAYPVVSSGSQMRILAQKFGGNQKFSATFTAVQKGCYEVSSSNMDAYSSSVANCNLTCSWLILANKDISVREIHLHPSHFTTQGQMVTVSTLDSNFQPNQLFFVTDSHVPAIRLPTNNSILVTTSQKFCSNETDVTLSGTYVTLPSTGCESTSTMTAGQQQMVASPGFPNTYPLNSDCWWNISSPTMYAFFSTVQLAPHHSVQLFDSKGPVAGYDNITSDVPGVLVNESLHVHFSSPLDNNTLASSYGFELTILALNEGQLVKTDEGYLATPEYPKPVDKSWTSIWIIQVEAKNQTCAILYNITFKPQTETQTVVTIHDGPSIQSEVNTNMSDVVHWSRTNTLVIVYNFTKEKESGPAFDISYKIKICNLTCGNGLCLHDDWRCNGHNDCGDNTDEIDCEASPTVPPPTSTPSPGGETRTGVSPVAVGVLTPFMFLLGVLVALTVPALYRKYRAAHRYSEFSNVGVE